MDPTGKKLKALNTSTSINGLAAYKTAWFEMDVDAQVWKKRSVDVDYHRRVNRTVTWLM
jgi:hypothetical protein